MGLIQSIKRHLEIREKKLKIIQIKEHLIFITNSNFDDAMKAQLILDLLKEIRNIENEIQKSKVPSKVI